MVGARSFLDERRERLRDPTVLANGIEAIEVDASERTQLTVLFVKPLPVLPDGVPLARNNIEITGGERFVSIDIVSVESTGNELVVVTSQVGDFSPYTLSLIDVSGFDPVLSSITFGFRTDCPADFDCAVSDQPELAPLPSPQIDYLAKDFEGFRRVMLDRMATLAPDWSDRNVADSGVAMVELAAYIADDLSYQLDATGTEAYLGTARRRTSAKRHARLVGYYMGDGVNARSPVQVNLDPTLAANIDINVLENELLFLTGTGSSGTSLIEVEDIVDAVNAGAIVYESMHAVRLRRGHEVIPFHDWGDNRAVLKAGTTQADLRDVGGVTDLQVGDFLVLAQRRDPDTARLSDADLRLRQTVRITEVVESLTDPLELDEEGTALSILRVRWHPEDALQFDLHIGRWPAGNAQADASGDNGPGAVAWGNIVLADHGWSMRNGGVIESLPPVPEEGDPMESLSPKILSELDRPLRYRPILNRTNITVAALAFDQEAEASDLSGTRRRVSALSALRVSNERATHAITLRDGGGNRWQPVTDLISSSSEARHFVVETDRQSQTTLRFGDDISGKKPDAQEPADITDRFTVNCRIGGGESGNVAAEAIQHVVSLGAVNGIIGARNPVSARGGEAPETVTQVRERAPVSFNEQKRAVTAEDYQTLVTARPDVQRARVRSLWTGSWKTFFIAIDRMGGLEVDSAFEDAIINYLEPFRTMGHDLAIEAPILIALEIELKICVSSDHFAPDVEKALLRVFSSVYIEGQAGFFHPDRLSFGEPIYLSKVYQAAMSVDGVDDVIVTQFRRWRTLGDSGLTSGVLRFSLSEIPVLENNRSFPGRGALNIMMEGGR